MENDIQKIVQNYETRECIKYPQIKQNKFQPPYEKPVLNFSNDLENARTK